MAALAAKLCDEEVLLRRRELPGAEVQQGREVAARSGRGARPAPLRRLRGFWEVAGRNCTHNSGNWPGPPPPGLELPLGQPGPPPGVQLPLRQKTAPPWPRTGMNEDFSASCSDVVSLAGSLLSFYGNQLCCLLLGILLYDEAH